ncbi:DUF5133 domain-containing protein [Streptomyces sp. NBC_00094]|uniref:DUF5133 domain-containing protein n=1 Tax=Streptomyces sp. NBC_00094 TaxID=2903620 RepID=UPI002251FAFE|nr:DUF5133 domain-containing protein [Streptomyces sp. NBC_00094]MCX5389056.1 DUF5133 domain-containing protein [Streptomyces sp. NBC_00094]
MAATPCSARDAKRILEAAADLALLAVDDLATVMIAGATGRPVPARVERALARAVEAARLSPASAAGPTALTPSRERTERVLARLRACRARLESTPEDPAAVREMDDAAYTLCVLMGRATTHEAVLAAERRLAAAA